MGVRLSHMRRCGLRVGSAARATMPESTAPGARGSHRACQHREVHVSRVVDQRSRCSCPPNRRLRRWRPDTIVNVCLTLCDRDGDCLAPTVCPNVYGLDMCAAPGCETDADCTADPCATCVPGVVRGRSHYWLDPSGSHCIYSGGCGPSSCDGCTDRGGGPIAPALGRWVVAAQARNDASPTVRPQGLAFPAPETRGNVPEGHGSPGRTRAPG